MQSGMLKIAALALALLVAVLLLYPREVERPPELANATLLPEPRPLPEFALESTAHAPFSNADLEGRFSLLFFGFTNCPDVCPITLQILAATAERLAAPASDQDAAPAPQVVFVSVDPHRDTPAKIRRYLDGFDPSFAGATGSDAALAPLLEALAVTVQRHDHQGELYNVVHNPTVYFVGPRGEWIALSSPPHDPAVLAADYVAVRAAYLRTSDAAVLDTTGSDGEEARTAVAR